MSKPNLSKGRPGTRLQLGQPGPYWKANLDMTSTSTVINHLIFVLLVTQFEPESFNKKSNTICHLQY